MASLFHDSTSAEEEVSDGELVACVQAGDVSAFGELFQRHNSQLCIYLARLTGNDDLGRDLAQDTFVKALDALLRAQEEIVYFKRWLYRIATNLVKDHWRRSRLIRWLPWPEKSSEEPGTSDENSREGSQGPREMVYMVLAGPEKEVEEAELVKTALAQVSQKYRPSLLLGIVEELPQREIAQILGKSERSVRRYIQRGYEELCEAYERLDTTGRRPVQ